MNKPLVYIAGPYTHPDPVINTHRNIQIGIQLAETGLAAVEIPHMTLIAHLIDPRPVEFWYAFDLDKLEHCQFLYRTSGQSVGADAEVARAQELGIFCYFEEKGEWDRLIDVLRGWAKAGQ